jgi:hypothetical protein
MNEEIKTAVEEAIAPLKQDIKALKAQLAPLVAMIPKPSALPPSVKEAQEVLKTIPQGTLDVLKVVNIGFDATKCWFSLLRQNGTSISVKKQEVDFRVRVRDQNGALVKEIATSMNGLVATLNSLV